MAATYLTDDVRDSLASARANGVEGVPAAAPLGADDLALFVLPSVDGMLHVVAFPAETMAIAADGSVVAISEPLPGRPLGSSTDATVASPVVTNMDFLRADPIAVMVCDQAATNICTIINYVTNHYYTLDPEIEGWRYLFVQDMHATVRSVNGAAMAYSAYIGIRPTENSRPYLSTHSTVVARDPMTESRSGLDQCAPRTLTVSADFNDATRSVSETVTACENWTPYGQSDPIGESLWKVQWWRPQTPPLPAAATREFASLQMFILEADVPSVPYGWEYWSWQWIPVASELSGGVDGPGDFGDPINSATGSFFDTVVDIDAPGGATELTWKRSYDSRNQRAYEGGVGWTPRWSSGIEWIDTSVVLYESDGRRTLWTPRSGGGWDGPEDFYGDLVQRPDGSLAVDYFDGSSAEFSVEGLLESERFADGRTVSLTRNPDSTLSIAASSTGASLTFTYAAGRVTRAEASDGRWASYSYGPSGALRTVSTQGASSTDELVTTYTTDAAGRIIEIHDPSGVLVVKNTYDAAGRVIRQENSTGGVTTITYNHEARTTTVVSDDGTTATYGHDANGNVQTVTDQLGNTTEKHWDANGNLTSVTSRRGGGASASYGEDDRLLSQATPSTGTSTFTYDAAGRLATSTEPTGALTTYGYDAAERLPTTVTVRPDPAQPAMSFISRYEIVDGLIMAFTDADGVRISYSYNSARQLATMTDGLGQTTSYDYFPEGWVSAETAPDGGVTAYTYFDNGWLASVTNQEGETTSYTYNNSGRPATATNPAGNVTEHQYNSGGQLAFLRQPGDVAGQFDVTEFHYDANGQLTETIRPAGVDGQPAVNSTAYGPFARVLSETDAEGRITSYGYDADGNTTTVTDPGGGTSATAYTPEGLEASTTTPTGLATTYEYDEFGRLESTIAPGGLTTTSTYDALGQEVGSVDPRGGVTATTYTPSGRTASTTDTAGTTTTYAYDGAGQLASTTIEGRTTRYGYDADGRPTTVTSPEGEITTTAYDQAGRKLSVTAPGGVTTTWTYNERGQVATESVSGAGTVDYDYLPSGRLGSVTDANGHTTSFGYDARGNRISRTNADGNNDVWVFNRADEVVAATDPLGRTTTYSRVYTPSDPVTGLVTTVADPSGRVHETVSAKDGQVLTERATLDSVTDATSFTYDMSGRRATATTGDGTWTYQWEPGGQPARVTAPDGRSLAWEYDTAGQMTSRRNGDGTTFDYGWSDGRLAWVGPAETFADGFSPPFGLDPSKWVDESAAGAATTVDGGRLQLAAQTSTAAVASQPHTGSDTTAQVGYDLSPGSRATVALPGGNGVYAIEFAQGEVDARLVHRSSTATRVLATFPAGGDTGTVRLRTSGATLYAKAWAANEPEPDWAVTQLDLEWCCNPYGPVRLEANQGTVSFDDVILLDESDAGQDRRSPLGIYTYNADNQPLSETSGFLTRQWQWEHGRLSHVDQTWLGSRHIADHTYDTAGRLATLTTRAAPGGPPTTTTYGFDPASQLTSLTSPAGNWAWAYDTVGRRTSQTAPDGVTSYSYDDASQLNDATGPAGTTVYDYDAAGRRVSQSGPDGTTTYRWDPMGRLDQLDAAWGTQARGYDPDGRLIELDHTGAGDVRLDWDPVGPVAELAGWTTSTDGATTLAAGPLGWSASRTADYSWRLLSDSLGSTYRLDDYYGEVPAASAYDAWGNPAETPDSTGTHLGYRGELHLGGLVHLRARDYDPTTGSFLSRDPLDGVTGTSTVANPYHYADNNPVNRIDPTGMRPGDPSISDLQWSGNFDELLEPGSPAAIAAAFEDDAPIGPPAPVKVRYDALQDRYQSGYDAEREFWGTNLWFLGDRHPEFFMGTGYQKDPDKVYTRIPDYRRGDVIYEVKSGVGGRCKDETRQQSSADRSIVLQHFTGQKPDYPSFAEWHFFRGRTGILGPSKCLKDRLGGWHIDMTKHVQPGKDTNEKPDCGLFDIFTFDCEHVVVIS